jgi:hypothetical protein
MCQRLIVSNLTLFVLLFLFLFFFEYQKIEATLKGRQWLACKNASQVAIRHAQGTGNAELVLESKITLIDVLIGEGCDDEAFEQGYIFPLLL